MVDLYSVDLVEYSIQKYANQTVIRNFLCFGGAILDILNLSLMSPPPKQVALSFIGHLTETFVSESLEVWPPTPEKKTAYA